MAWKQRDDVLNVVAELGVFEGQERADVNAGDDEQDDRERDLRYDNRVAQTRKKRAR